MVIGLSGSLVPVKAAVSSSPTFELDASNASSLATSGATTWRDLVSGGSITGALVGNAAYKCPKGVAVETWTIAGGKHLPKINTAFTSSVFDFLLAHKK
jgi:hypothetical protein